MPSFLKNKIAIRYAVVIFVLALVARFVVLFFLLGYGGEEALVLGDSGRYLSLAQSVVSGEGYVYEGFPESFRAPGYPVYLMLFELLHLPLTIASLFQILVASFIPVILFYISIRFLLFSPTVGLIAGIFAAIEPVQVFYSVVLLPDVFVGILFLLMVFFLCEWFETYHVRYAVVAGTLLGLMNYERPVGLYMGVFLVLSFGIYLLWKRSLTKQKCLHLLLFFLCSLVVALPWSIRNWYQFNEFSFVSSSAYTFYAYGAVTPVAIDTGREYEAVKQEFLAKLRAEGPGGNDEVSFKNRSYLIGTTISVIKSHPVAYLKAYLLGVNTFLFSGNYHYLLMKYDLIGRPEKIISFSLVLAEEGIGRLVQAIGTRLGDPYFLIAFIGKIFWVILTSVSIIGGLIFYRKPLSIIYLLSMAYFVITILAVTIGVEARHRYMLNPFIFLFFTALLFTVYNALWRNGRTG